MKIKGIPVGTTMPRPDWNQTDPNKADYIRNKPDLRPDWNQDDSSQSNYIRNRPIKNSGTGGLILTDLQENHMALNNAIAAGQTIWRKYKEGENVPVKPPESDRRYCEAIGEASIAAGMGAVAYSRASKSLGYRTQTGQPPDPWSLEARPEARYTRDEEGNPLYPSDNAGQAAIAIGADTAALGNHSLAGGSGSIAKGASAFAFGSNVEASGDYSIATGVGCTASGIKSFAGGAVSEATAAHAFAFGYHNKASGEKAVAMGHQVEASGANSVAFGSNTKAKATSCIAAGHTSEANTKYAAAMGYFVQTSDSANAIGQMVVGRYNSTEGTEKAMFVVGTGNGENTRKNALVVNRDGSIVVGTGCYGDKLPDTGVEGQLFFLKV